MHLKSHLLVFIASLNFIITRAVPLIQDNENITLIELYPNDIFELKCEFPIMDLLDNTSNKTMQNGSINDKLENGFKLGIFKKDNILIQLHRSVLKLKIANMSDQGIYECGFYDVNRFGNMSYIFQKSWLVRVLEFKQETEFSSYIRNLADDNLKKVNFNIFKSMPIKMSVLGFLFVSVLVLTFLFLMRNNLARTRDRSVIKTQVF